MFKSKFFAAYHWLARYWRGDSEVTPPTPIGWIIYDFDLYICRQVDISFSIKSKQDFDLYITRLRDFDGRDSCG